MMQAVCGMVGDQGVPIGIAIMISTILMMLALSFGVWLGSNWDCK